MGTIIPREGCQKHDSAATSKTGNQRPKKRPQHTNHAHHCQLGRILRMNFSNCGASRACAATSGCAPHQLLPSSPAPDSCKARHGVRVGVREGQASRSSSGQQAPRTSNIRRVSTCYAGNRSGCLNRWHAPTTLPAPPTCSMCTFSTPAARSRSNAATIHCWYCCAWSGVSTPASSCSRGHTRLTMAAEG